MGGLLPRPRGLRQSSPGADPRRRIFEEDLDTGIDFDSLAAKKTMLGSGGFVVMDDTTCMVRASTNVRALLRARIMRPVYAVPGRRPMGGQDGNATGGRRGFAKRLARARHDQ